MQRRILRAFIAMLALTLASCGGGGMVKRINPPAASVQQLRVADDGSWSLVLRINNFSTVPMTCFSVTSVALIWIMPPSTMMMSPAFRSLPKSG